MSNSLDRSEIMDYRVVLEIIAHAAMKKETVEIYYPGTENSPEGWREIEPYAITTDIGEDVEDLVYGKDLISSGHILRAYTIGSGEDRCHSFIIGKIQKARITRRKFIPNKNWKVKF